MGAKRKLNGANVCGTFLVAGLLGWVTGSVAVFLIALAVLLAVSYYAGDIRR
jgi:hypothetical protein